MTQSLKRKLNQLLKLIESVIGGIRFAFTLSIAIVCIIALVFSLLVWPLFPPAVAIVIVLAVLAVIFIKMKEGQVDEVLEKVETFVKSDDAEEHSRLEGVVDQVVDTVLDSIADTFLIVPLGCIVGGVLFFVAGLHQVGAVLLILGVLFLAGSLCLCGIVKHVTHGQIHKLFADEDSEASPLME